ncbi:MAG: DUF4340 domain-containing protein [Deltaproteobacteria bacterium]|nr:DUF4340 domain-containing protein [Deltaproteobacteria bacterium]
MNEARALSAILAVLLVASYLTWTREEKKETSGAPQKVTVVDAKSEDLKEVVLITRTQTVALQRKKDAEQKPYSWFEIETKSGKRGFVGNDKTADFMKDFAPFVALRSLGTALDDKELEETKLKHPEKKLVLRFEKNDRVFSIGGRTYGSRDHYVRPRDGKEAFLIESKLLGDLEYPEGRFMQRNLRELEPKNVTDIVIRARGKERRVVHQNRLSDKDAYWADANKPDEKNETLENYVDKIEKLTARKYRPAGEEPKGEAVLEVVWLEDGKVKETMMLEKAKDEYFARSGVTHLWTEVSKSTAQQLETDLETILRDQ